MGTIIFIFYLSLKIDLTSHLPSAEDLLQLAFKEFYIYQFSLRCVFNRILVYRNLLFLLRYHILNFKLKERAAG